MQSHVYKQILRLHFIKEQLLQRLLYLALSCIYTTGRGPIHVEVTFSFPCSLSFYFLFSIYHFQVQTLFLFIFLRHVFSYFQAHYSTCLQERKRESMDSIPLKKLFGYRVLLFPFPIHYSKSLYFDSPSPLHLKTRVRETPIDHLPHSHNHPTTTTSIHKNQLRTS